MKHIGSGFMVVFLPGIVILVIIFVLATNGSSSGSNRSRQHTAAAPTTSTPPTTSTTTTEPATADARRDRHGAGVHDDELAAPADRRLDHERRLAGEPALLAARPDHASNVSQLKGVWLTHLRRSGDRREVLGREPAARVQGHDLRADGRRRRVRGQRRHRQDPLAVRGEPRPEDQHRLLRLGQPRRGDRRRPGLHRPARRQARRARPEDRQGRLDDAGRPSGRTATRSPTRRSTSTAW